MIGDASTELDLQGLWLKLRILFRAASNMVALAVPADFDTH